MRKAILFILATMMMASCAEHQVFDDVALDAPEYVKKTENFNDLMAQARWGDGNAYLKLADYYVNGQNGTRPDFMATISMLNMAREYGAIGRPGEYISNLPEDDNTRMAFEAMESINNRQKEKGMELADRLIEKGCVDGYALKGYAIMEAGDTIEAIRLVTLAAEQGSSLGRALQYVIPYGQRKEMPDESVMLPLAEAIPIFYLFMAEEYDKQLAEHPENELKVARCYLKADENGCLDQRGANWLLSYKERGNELPLAETDILRLLKLAGYERVDTTADGCVEFENELWEEPIDSVTKEETIEAVEDAKKAVEMTKTNEEDNINHNDEERP
ncbi:MAG: sel1 repeat family protein [Prevotella sp.]|nr:sel1 repeat family protein [Prevotella sp.]